MNIFKKILKTIRQILYILGTPAGVLAINKFFPKGIDSVLNLVCTYKLSILLLMTFIIPVTFVEFYYLLIYRKKLKLLFRFGVYWDKELNPYCNRCNIHYSYKHDDDYVFVELKCSKCNNTPILSADGINEITIKEARELIKMEKIGNQP